VEQLHRQTLAGYRVLLALWLLGHLSWLIGNLTVAFELGELTYFGYFFKIHLARPIIGIVLGLIALTTSKWLVTRLLP
jgi:site-specific recombinase